VDVEAADPDQEVVDHGVEEAVVLHVVHVPVDVVVLPAQRDPQKVRKDAPVHRPTIRCGA
jgi:hypothetical protein